jgi:hypothetical protein
MRYFKAAAIFLLTFTAIAAFAPGDAGNPGQVTRFGLAYSISEGRLDIDQFRDLTVDIAKFEDHYYADKPPGLSLIAAPAVALARSRMDIPPGKWPLTGEQTWTLTKVAALSSVGVLASLAAAVLYLLARRLGASDGAALFAACGLALGTPFLNWSTTIFPHAATGSLLIITLALIVWSREWRSPWIGAVVGVLLGYGITIDLTAAPAAVVLGVYYAFGERGPAWQRMLAGTLGGLIGLLPLLAYNALVFHSPFKLGYSEVVGFEGMKVGLFGLTWPSPAVIFEIIFGARRGLLPLSPLLVLIPVGWWAMWRRPDLRGVLGVTLCIALSFVLINASYYYWDGGSSTGPRHIVAALPVICLALAFAWPRGTGTRLAAGTLLVVSLFISAAVPGVQQFAPVDYAFPLLEPILSGVAAGKLEWLGYMIAPWLGFAALGLLRERSGAEARPAS